MSHILGHLAVELSRFAGRTTPRAQPQNFYSPDMHGLAESHNITNPNYCAGLAGATGLARAGDADPAPGDFG